MESHEISFVTWPDGKVDGGSLTVAGREIAKQQMVSQWLPKEWFGALTGSQVHYLFAGMEAKGFRVHTITIGADGVPNLKES